MLLCCILQLTHIAAYTQSTLCVSDAKNLHFRHLECTKNITLREQSKKFVMFNFLFVYFRIKTSFYVIMC